jgi:Flp pilus assembly protein TadD
MHLTRDASWILVSVLAATSTGCAHMPGREWFSKTTGLPSPGATVAKGEESTDLQAPISLEIARGRNFERSGQLDKARKVYEELRKREPENAMVAHRLGVVADSQRRHGEAEQLFLFALEREPKDAQVMSDLGYCYYLQGKLEDAEPYLREAVKQQPANARFRNNLGLVLGHLGRIDEALVEFRAGGNEADAQFNLAFVYASQDQVEKAKVCFRNALSIDPAHRRAREALASFEEYENKPASLRDAEIELAEIGGRWVPYQENGGVQQAAAQTPLPTARDASKATRALQQQSRGLGRSE